MFTSPSLALTSNPALRGKTGPFDNVIKWNVSLLDCSLEYSGKGWIFFGGVDKELKYFQRS